MACCWACFLGGGFLLQTTGLQTTSAGLSGFLTGSSVVMVPVVASVVFSTRVSPQGWLAVGLSAAGLVLLTGGPGRRPDRRVRCSPWPARPASRGTSPP